MMGAVWKRTHDTNLAGRVFSMFGVGIRPWVLTGARNPIRSDPQIDDPDVDAQTVDDGVCVGMESCPSSRPRFHCEAAIGRLLG